MIQNSYCVITYIHSTLLFRFWSHVSLNNRKFIFGKNYIVFGFIRCVYKYGIYQTFYYYHESQNNHRFDNYITVLVRIISYVRFGHQDQSSVLFYYIMISSSFSLAVVVVVHSGLYHFIDVISFPRTRQTLYFKLTTNLQKP